MALPPRGRQHLLDIEVLTVFAGLEDGPAGNLEFRAGLEVAREVAVPRRGEVLGQLLAVAEELEGAPIGHDLDVRAPAPAGLHVSDVAELRGHRAVIVAVVVAGVAVEEGRGDAFLGRENLRCPFLDLAVQILNRGLKLDGQRVDAAVRADAALEGEQAGRGFDIRCTAIRVEVAVALGIRVVSPVDMTEHGPDVLARAAGASEFLAGATGRLGRPADHEEFVAVGRVIDLEVFPGRADDPDGLAWAGRTRPAFLHGHGIILLLVWGEE